MADGDPERPDRPDYNVYRAGSGGRRRGKRADEPSGKPAKSSAPKGGDGASEEGPGYTVYKSRGGIKRPSLGGLGGIRERLGRGEGSRAGDAERPTWRRVLRWAAVAAGAWLLLSIVLFVISAQIQKGKLDGATADVLGAFPLLVAKGETILVIGTDARPAGTDEGGVDDNPKCLERAATGAATANVCNPPSRSDTLMLVRAGGGAFQKLSIPRDTFADIPGQPAQKINGAYAFGGAKLEIQTIERFLGIDIDHVVILDFTGFADFIDSIGGVTVNLPEKVVSLISGGASNGGITLKLERGANELDGQQALALARTRENRANPGEDDTARAKRQQLILQGIKSQLTSPWRAPINFLRGPWIGWNAPKAMISDMGGFTLPQLAMAAAIGGDSGTKILNPSGMTADGALIVAKKQCRRAVDDFLGGPGPRPPACSPGAP